MDAAGFKEVLIVIAILYALGVLISVITYLKPPRKINGLYGFRTDTSMKNQSNWDYANRIFPKYLFLLTHCLTVFILTVVWLLREKIPVEGAVIIACTLNSFSMIMLLAVIEIKVTKFD